MVFSGTVQSDFLKYLPSQPTNQTNLLDFAAGDFASFRDTLLNYIKATYPLDYNNFSESDFGILLVELMAAIGHINSVKADFLANENFIRTARNRQSVKNLLELIGVRMKGPIAAVANAEITGQALTVLSPSSVTINEGDRVISIASPEDGGALTYTIYKVQSDGSVNLDRSSNNLIFDISSIGGAFTIDDAVLIEGALVVESGIFRSPDQIKSIRLSQYPYIEKSAQIFIEGSVDTAGVYLEEENLYFASGANDKIFQIITDDKFAATVLFGDNTIGKSPSIGDQYTISYRVGGGSRGNIAKEFINAPVTFTISNGVDEETTTGVLKNSTKATGGADAESIAHAKKYAPLIFRRQDRLVTLHDYIGFVNSFISNYGSTGKANAIVRRAYSSANIIDIFVLEKASDTQLRKATSEYKRQLIEAIKEKKMLTDEPVVVDGLIRTLDIITTIRLDSKYRNNESELRLKTKDKILEYFNTDNTEFGQEFNPQSLVKYLLDINEIRYVTIDNVDSPIKVAFNEIIQLNNLTVNVAFI